jgi:hypothetical protein
MAGRALCVLFGTALLSIVDPPPPSHAQDRAERAAARAKRSDKPRAKAKPRAARSKRTRERAAAADQPPAESNARGKSREAGPATGAPPTAAQAAQAAAAGVDAEIVKEGDTSVKVMKFTGLGIEGRLKSPQLVYFVQRVRAEFDRPELPHRSFMPELERTTEREPVR